MYEDLLTQGYRIFPVHGIVDGHCTCGKAKCGSPGKHPVSAGWKGQATSDPEAAKHLFTNPNYNAGIATGSGLVVIDLDGADGLATLKAWESRLPMTPQAQTGGGGRHLFYHSDVVIHNSVRKLGPGVDVRGEGGFVVAPGSTHISGNKYKWLQAGLFIAPLPKFLLDKITSPSATKEPTSVPTEPGASVGEGGRNDTLFKHGIRLRERGWTMRQIDFELRRYNEEHCVPPLPKEEVKLIVDSIDRNPRGQTLEEEFALREHKKERNIQEYEFIHMAALMQTDLPPTQWVAKDLLSHGLGILASPPKFGKSWMALDLGICVAAGRPFIGFPTTQAGVLYLALEDGKSRLKSRTGKVLSKYGISIPTNFYSAIDTKTMKEGLLDILQAHVDRHPDCKLIIIDTLQKIRDGATSNKEGAYATDYRELSALKTFADVNNLCVLLLHHLRKMADDGDPMNRISGTAGVQGVADTMMVLTRKKRLDDITTLTVSGRDITRGDVEYQIRFDRPTASWQMMGESKQLAEVTENLEYKGDALTQTVLQLVQVTGSWEGSVAELTDHCATNGGEPLTPVALGKRLAKWAHKLREMDNVVYEATRTAKSRGYRFTRSFL